MELGELGEAQRAQHAQHAQHAQPEGIGVSVVPQDHGDSGGGLRRRGGNQLPLPLSRYQKLDVLSQTERTWVTRLVVSSLIDLGLSFFAAALAFGTAYRDSGVSLYCIGLQATAHWLASLCLVLRFWKESRFGRYKDRDGRTGDEGDEEEELLLNERRSDFQREQTFSVVIAIIMILMSAPLMFKAARKFRFWDKWSPDHALQDETVTRLSEMLAWKCGIVYTCHAGLRWLARLDLPGHKFVSHVLCVSLASFLTCFVLGVGASYQREWSWKAEPICASLLAVCLLVEGMRIVFVYFDDIDDLMTRHARP